MPSNTRNWASHCEWAVQAGAVTKNEIERHFKQIGDFPASACRTPAMAAGTGKNFRTGNVAAAMVVLHIVFRLGYTRKHYPGTFRTC